MFSSFYVDNKTHTRLVYVKQPKKKKKIGGMLVK